MPNGPLIDTGIVISVKFLTRRSKSDLTKKETADWAQLGGMAVVGRFTHYVSKVDTLPKHVAGRRRLRRGNA